MPSKRMEYPSLKSVLQCLEANKRFDLVRRCPSLKNADKTTPLPIQWLQFGPNNLVINSTFYYLGVIRHYPNDVTDIPKRFRMENEAGGVHYDLNEFGFRDRSRDEVATPGDVRIQAAPGQEEEPGRFENGLLMQSLYRYEPVPFKMYIQVTKGNDEVMNLKCEYLEYNKKLDEAVRYLSSHFFGGRKYPIQAKGLKLPVTGAVIRLPEHLKLSKAQRNHPFYGCELKRT